MNNGHRLPYLAGPFRAAVGRMYRNATDFTNYDEVNELLQLDQRKIETYQAK